MESALKDLCADYVTNASSKTPPSLIIAGDKESNTINIPGSAPANSLDWSVVQRGCAALIMYINNIRNQPNVPRYRRISTTNSSFRGQVEPLVGYDKVLEAVGFSKKGSHYEWAWEMGPKSNSNSSNNLEAIATSTATATATATSSGSGLGPASSSCAVATTPDVTSVEAILSDAVKHLEALKVGEVAFKASIINSRQLYLAKDIAHTVNSSFQYDDIYDPKGSVTPSATPMRKAGVTTPTHVAHSYSPMNTPLQSMSVSHPSSPYSPLTSLGLSHLPSIINRSNNNNGTNGTLGSTSKALGGNNSNANIPSFPLAFDDVSYVCVCVCVCV